MTPFRLAAATAGKSEYKFNEINKKAAAQYEWRWMIWNEKACKYIRHCRSLSA